MTQRLLPIALVIAAGLLSRATHTGWILIDKYLGDAFYAALVFLLLPPLPPVRRAAIAMGVMTGIELFQLTNIPAQMVADTRLPVRVIGRLLGTVYSWADLVAYAAGITAAAAAAAWR